MWVLPPGCGGSPQKGAGGGGAGRGQLKTSSSQQLQSCAVSLQGGDGAKPRLLVLPAVRSASCLIAAAIRFVSFPLLLSHAVKTL